MSKRFPKPEITLDGIYSKFADEGFCKDFLLDIRFEKGFACPFCGGSEYRRIRSRHLLRCKFCILEITCYFFIFALTLSTLSIFSKIRLKRRKIGLLKVDKTVSICVNFCISVLK